MRVRKATPIKILEETDPEFNVLIENPFFAMHHAYVNGGSDKIRELVLSENNPDTAIRYALYIDECPRNDTRKAACKGAYTALDYAINVDKCAHSRTRKACARSAKAKAEYEEAFGKEEEPKNE